MHKILDGSKFDAYHWNTLFYYISDCDCNRICFLSNATGFIFEYCLVLASIALNRDTCMDKPYSSYAFHVCKAGARFGCSVSASARCKPPWWKSLFGLGSMDLSEREQCEEREMSACLAAAKESCLQLAKEKCLPAFRDARIALPDWNRLDELQQRTVSSASSPKGIESKSMMLCQLSLDHLSECYPQATNYKGHVLLEGTISLGSSKDGRSSGLVPDRT